VAKDARGRGLRRARGLVFLRRLGVWLVPEGRLRRAGGLVFLRGLARGLAGTSAKDAARGGSVEAGGLPRGWVKG
jgi:hypothetical protein